MKRKSPKLSYLENARFENDIEYIGLEINENPKEKMILNDMTFDSCIFNKIDFSNMILNNVSFLDCIFRECDLANKEFENIFIIRTEFFNSRLTGVNISKSKLQDVLFGDSLMNYFAISDCAVENTEFINCNLISSRLFNLKLKNTEFKESVMRDFEVINTSLKGIDLSTDEISNLLVNIGDIAGIKVNMSQAIDLLKLLEIEVK